MILKRSQRKIVLLRAKLLEQLSDDEHTIPSNPFTHAESTERRWVIKRKRRSGEKGDFYVAVIGGKIQSSISISFDETEKYVRGKVPQPSTLEKYDNFCRYYFGGRFNDFRYPLSEKHHELTLFEFATLIGYEEAEARFIVDCHYSTHFPTFRSFAESKTKSVERIDELGGLYSVYRIDRNQATNKHNFTFGVVAKACLSVRYPVPFKNFDNEAVGAIAGIGAVDGHKKFRIRCKLNVPKYINREELLTSDAHSETIRFFKYDGYVSRLRQNADAWNQWLFQQRPLEYHRNSQDLILMYTKSKPDNIEYYTASEASGNISLFSGYMAYQDQSEGVLPTMSKVLLVRHLDYRFIQTQLRSSIASTGIVNPEHFYSVEQGERPFMREPRLLDIQDDSTWDEIDKLAIPRLVEIADETP